MGELIHEFLLGFQRQLCWFEVANGDQREPAGHLGNATPTDAMFFGLGWFFCLASADEEAISSITVLQAPEGMHRVVLAQLLAIRLVQDDQIAEVFAWQQDGEPTTPFIGGILIGPPYLGLTIKD